MAKAHRKGEPSRIRRNVQQNDDPYLPKLDPGQAGVCTRCHAIYQRRHWFFDEPLFNQIAVQAQTRHILCPACRKIGRQLSRG